MSGYFTKETLLLICCAFVGRNIKAVKNNIFYFIFILTYFGQLPIISPSLLQTIISFNLYYF
jgi:hypothetical protein